MQASRKREARRRRHQRTRKTIRGIAAQPRLSVYRSNTNIYAQLIDDREGRTLVAASSRESGIETSEDGGKIDAARQVGKLIGERAVEQGITTVVFDRGGNRYAGRVAALAEGARDAGLKF
ncbi:MAG: 50S ribosomal protein L18 [Nitriliruptor sp.]|uniref:50S ribosomal protein L18 n=1 Tax=Nitriliruptor sp. TaxID=2448056 RepID=UPI00349FD9B2